MAGLVWLQGEQGEEIKASDMHNTHNNQLYQPSPMSISNTSCVEIFSVDSNNVCKKILFI